MHSVAIFITFNQLSYKHSKGILRFTSDNIIGRNVTDIVALSAEILLCLVPLS
jgi:hypothetical protein